MNMNNTDQIVTTLPTVKEMVQNGYTYHHWLQYYINVWKRQIMAASIDIKCDQIRKAIDPEMQVEDQQMIVPVKQRLENRKLKMQDYLSVLAGAEALYAIPEEEIEAKLLSEEALAVDSDMIDLPVKTDEDVEKTDGESTLTPVEPVKEEEAK